MDYSSATDNSIVVGLEQKRDAIAELESKLAVLRLERDALAMELRKRGWVLRAIEPHTGVSNVYINRLERMNLE